MSLKQTPAGILQTFCRIRMRYVCRSAIAALLVFPPSITLSQKGEPEFDHITVDDGLPSNGVWRILQDSRGLLWFGTDDGLARYDGRDFTVFRHDPLDANSPPGNNFGRGIFEDSSGALWTWVCEFQYSRFDRGSETFTTFHTSPFGVLFCYMDVTGTFWISACGEGLRRHDGTGKGFTTYSLSSDTLDAVCADQDEPARILWVASPGGLDKLDIVRGTFSHYKLGYRSRVNMMLADRLGMLWIGTDEGLFEFDRNSGRYSQFLVAKEGPDNAQNNTVRSMYEDAEDMLWIGTGYGLFRVDRANGTFHEYPNARLPAPRPGRQTYSFLEDNNRFLWVATQGSGVGRYDRRKDRFTMYTKDLNNPHSLTDDHVNTCLKDKAGNLWFGTWWGGVNVIHGAHKKFRHYTYNPSDPKSLSGKDVRGLIVDKRGVLWVGTMNGLNRYDSINGTFTRYRHKPGDPESLASDRILSLLEDRTGTLWIGTHGSGLDRFDPGGKGGGKEKFTHYVHDPKNPNSLNHNRILSLYEDHSGTLWVGTAMGGLDEFHRSSGAFTHHTYIQKDSGSLSSVWVNTIYEDKSNTLWVGVGGGGLNRLDRGTGKFSHFYWMGATNTNGLSYASVHSIYEDRRGTLWVGTGAGLDRFEPQTETFKHYTVRSGFASDFISAIMEDESGCLWLKTGKGISRFDPETGDIRNYDARDGIQINPTWGKSSYKGPHGEMYFGGMNGFVSFHPDSIRDNPYVPPIVITGFRKFDKKVHLDTIISEKKVLNLSYQDNVFSFEFAALNYTSPENNQYAYKLEGFDQDWLYCGTTRYARYTNLDGGTYVFRVKGSNNDGVWNDSGTSITVIISPPFWKTWWFRGALFLVVAAAIGGTVRAIEMKKARRRMHAMEQQHALEQERLRISMDMHDEVGTSLTKIAIMSELAMRKGDRGGAKTKELREISSATRETIDSIGSIIWAINPANSTLDILVAYVRDSASEYLERIGMRYSFDFPLQIPPHLLSTEVRRTIFLAVKEAIHNAVKHSGATSVKVSCRVSASDVEFNVEDNGNGFIVEHARRNGNGLNNMTKRANDVHGTLKIESHIGCGTKIQLAVPLS